MKVGYGQALLIDLNNSPFKSSIHLNPLSIWKEVV